MDMYREHGFTLVEMVITIVIAAIALAIATPSMLGMVASNNATNEANRIISSLSLARSEAIKRNMAVNVGSKGSGTDWSDGWQVYSDADSPASGNTNYSAAQDVLVEDADEVADGVTISVAPSQNWIAYGGSGFLMESGLASIDIWVCADINGNTAQRHITISRSGRPSVDDAGGGC
ncbi:Tfp pilus assembly protein FimT, putative [gamma proteobacterium HTCC5015]|nr:Tfp pilus assembly protein FimT, putative [gamma proteobacterium HTCC5015]